MEAYSYRFTKDEFQSFLYAYFLIALVIFFFIWRDTDFSLASGLSFFVINFLFIFIVGYFARMLQKFVALKKGYKTTYKNTWQGMVISVTLAFFSFGLLPVVAPGYLKMEPIDRLRTGKWHTGYSYKDMAHVNLIAPLIYLGFVMLLKVFFVSKEATPLIFKLMIGCIIMAVFSLLPIPSFEGIGIFAHSRLLYVFLFVFVLIYAILVIFTSMFYVMIPLLAAIVFTAFFIFKVDDGVF